LPYPSQNYPTFARRGSTSRKMPETESEQQRTRDNKLHKQLTEYLQSEELRKKVSSSRTTHQSSTPDLSTLTHTQRTGRPPELPAMLVRRARTRLGPSRRARRRAGLALPCAKGIPERQPTVRGRRPGYLPRRLHGVDSAHGCEAWLLGLVGLDEEVEHIFSQGAQVGGCYAAGMQGMGLVLCCRPFFTLRRNDMLTVGFFCSACRLF
jgi:hypothetical protein